MYCGAIYVGSKKITDILSSSFEFLPEYSSEFEFDEGATEEDTFKLETLVRINKRAVIIEEFEGPYATLGFINPKTNKIVTLDVSHLFVGEE